MIIERRPFSENELEGAVKKTNTGKAPGRDGILPETIKALYLVKPKELELFEKCCREGRFPKEWEWARPVLIQKKGKED